MTELNLTKLRTDSIQEPDEWQDYFGNIWLLWLQHIVNRFHQGDPPPHISQEDLDNILLDEDLEDLTGEDLVWRKLESILTLANDKKVKPADLLLKNADQVLLDLAQIAVETKLPVSFSNLEKRIGPDFQDWFYDAYLQFYPEQTWPDIHTEKIYLPLVGKDFKGDQYGYVAVLSIRMFSEGNGEIHPSPRFWNLETDNKNSFIQAIQESLQIALKQMGLTHSENLHFGWYLTLADNDEGDIPEIEGQSGMLAAALLICNLLKMKKPKITSWKYLDFNGIAASARMIEREGDFFLGGVSIEHKIPRLELLAKKGELKTAVFAGDQDDLPSEETTTFLITQAETLSEVNQKIRKLQRRFWKNLGIGIAAILVLFGGYFGINHGWRYLKTRPYYGESAINTLQGDLTETYRVFSPDKKFFITEEPLGSGKFQLFWQQQPGEFTRHKHELDLLKGSGNAVKALCVGNKSFSVMYHGGDLPGITNIRVDPDSGDMDLPWWEITGRVCTVPGQDEQTGKFSPFHAVAFVKGDMDKVKLLLDDKFWTEKVEVDIQQNWEKKAFCNWNVLDSFKHGSIDPQAKIYANNGLYYLTGAGSDSKPGLIRLFWRNHVNDKFKPHLRIFDPLAGEEIKGITFDNKNPDRFAVLVSSKAQVFNIKPKEEEWWQLSGENHEFLHPDGTKNSCEEYHAVSFNPKRNELLALKSEQDTLADYGLINKPKPVDPIPALFAGDNLITSLERLIPSGFRLAVPGEGYYLTMQDPESGKLMLFRKLSDNHSIQVGKTLDILQGFPNPLKGITITLDKPFIFGLHFHKGMKPGVSFFELDLDDEKNWCREIGKIEKIPDSENPQEDLLLKSHGIVFNPANRNEIFAGRKVNNRLLTFCGIIQPFKPELIDSPFDKPLMRDTQLNTLRERIPPGFKVCSKDKKVYITSDGKPDSGRFKLFYKIPKKDEYRASSQILDVLHGHNNDLKAIAFDEYSKETRLALHYHGGVKNGVTIYRVRWLEPAPWWLEVGRGSNQDNFHSVLFAKDPDKIMLQKTKSSKPISAEIDYDFPLKTFTGPHILDSLTTGIQNGARCYSLNGRFGLVVDTELHGLKLLYRDSTEEAFREHPLILPIPEMLTDNEVKALSFAGNNPELFGILFHGGPKPGIQVYTINVKTLQGLWAREIGRALPPEKNPNFSGFHAISFDGKDRKTILALKSDKKTIEKLSCKYLPEFQEKPELSKNFAEAKHLVGVNLTSYNVGEFFSEKAEQSLAQLKNEAGKVNTVVVVVTWYYDPETGLISLKYGKSPDELDIRTIIRQARKRDYFTALKIHIDKADDPDFWRGDIIPEKPAAFFKSYLDFVKTMATISRREKVDLVFFGTETKAISAEPEYRDCWDKIIAAAVASKSRISYAANWNEYEQLGHFWNDPRIDYIAINSYFPLTGPQDADPSLEQLRKGWQVYLDKEGEEHHWLAEIEAVQRKFGKKVLMSEIGYVSWDFSSLEPNIYKGKNYQYNGLLQKKCYQVLFEVLNQSSFINGVFLWNWELQGITDGKDKKTHSPQGKPVMEILAND